MSTVVMALEGVLRSDFGQPIREGMLLFRSLIAMNKRVVLVLDDLEPRLAEHFLKTEGISKLAELVEAHPVYEGVQLRRHQLVQQRARDQVDFLVDSSPDNIAAALEDGITGLLFAQPVYLRGEWRPDLESTVTPWAEITAELERQTLAKAADKRGSDPDLVSSD